MSKASRPGARLSMLAAALAVSMLAPDGWAQSAKDLARARERFKEGAASQAAGDFASALEAYKDVALVKSSAQVRFNIATCEEKLGDYVRAVGSYRLALTEATRSSSKDIEGAVQKALADLEPRVPMLLVRRGEGALQIPVGLHVSTPLPAALHWVWPMTHVPEHAPETQVWSEHATGLLHTPGAVSSELHVSTPLPTHWSVPGEHWTHEPLKHTGVAPEHIDCVHWPMLLQVCSTLPLHCVWPGPHTPVHTVATQVWLAPQSVEDMQPGTHVLVALQ
jgi:hypothetical protein